MNKKLHAVICPHPPLPLPNVRHKNHFEVNPIRVDSLVHAIVRFDPVTINVTRIRLFSAEAAVDKNLIYPSHPKRFDCRSKPFQEPPSSWSEPEPPSDFLQCCPI